MKFFTYKRNRNAKRLVSALLVATFLMSLTAVSRLSVFATTAEEIKKQAEEDLEDTNKDIDAAQDNLDKVNAEIASTKKKLTTLMANQEVLQGEIEVKQEEVAQAAIDLAEANETLAEEYEAMKLRIQFMYENNTEESIWKAILEADGLADMLIRVEYFSDVYESDRKLMKAYETALHNVEELTIRLNAEMDELLAKQEEYEEQQSELESIVASLQDKKDKYKTELAKLEDLKQEYQETISVQAEIMRQQEAEAARVQAATYEGGGTGESNSLGNADYLTDNSYNPSPVTSVSGAEIVAYAMQFVGNRYVWGGNSLTDGVDCSGFVHQVYKHFGIATPRYSQSFKTVGQPVAYENMQAGDVVVYAGHVAIYIGNGCIVEAQSTKAGITNSRSVNCHKITAIRRLV